MERVLIIKTGYSEVLDYAYNSAKPSLGDILRTTVILHPYKGDEVTWLTDKEAFPLLEGNKYIRRLLPLNFTTSMELLDEEFDTVINLEKNHDICKFSSKISAWKRYGFRFDKKTNSAHAYDRALEILSVSSDISLKKENNKSMQELLFEVIGKKWNGEEYILGYEPPTKETYDFGLNSKVGEKWPIKIWKKENWDNLEDLLIKKGFKVSRQDKQGPKVLGNLYGYIDWINSCKSIISTDSLGMHMGIVLRKKVLGLFGPTSYKEVYFYNRGEAIIPEKKLDCMPCFSDKCEREKSCLDYITPELVYEKTKKYV